MEIDKAPRREMPSTTVVRNLNFAGSLRKTVQHSVGWERSLPVQHLIPVPMTTLSAVPVQLRNPNTRAHQSPPHPGTGAGAQHRQQQPRVGLCGMCGMRYLGVASGFLQTYGF